MPAKLAKDCLRPAGICTLAGTEASIPMWFSQLFENTINGGVFLALPYEGISHWTGNDDEYDEILDEIDNFLIHPFGAVHGIFVGEDDGVHQAHWIRPTPNEDLILAVWSAWNDPQRSSYPDSEMDLNQRWRSHQDPRQAWLQKKLEEPLAWSLGTSSYSLPSGVLLLQHAEGSARKARLARPEKIAQCGETVPVGMMPGKYFLDTLLINELPEGDDLVCLCRWRPNF